MEEMLWSFNTTFNNISVILVVVGFIDLLLLLRFLLFLFLLLLFFSFFSFLSADHELVHGRSQELLDRISPCFGSHCENGRHFENFENAELLL
jgi:hypothetical protein